MQKKIKIKKTIAEKVLHLNSHFWAKMYTLLLKSSFYTFGNKSTIFPPFRHANLPYISIGNGVTVHSSCWIQALPNYHVSEIKPILTIGNNCGIGMNATITAAMNIILEDHVFLGRNVFITDHSHKFDDVDIPIGMQGITKMTPVRIGKDSWLGHGVVIIPGADIGNHCVIGANSVVNSKIPDFSVAVGSPAKVVSQFDFSLNRWVRVK